MIGDDTGEVSSKSTTTARNFCCGPQELESEILRRVANVGIEEVARAIKRDKSRVSLILSDQAGVKVKFLYQFLDALGLKIVPKTACVITAEEHWACRHLARQYLELTSGSG